MKKQDVRKIAEKSLEELRKDAQNLREEMARLSLDFKVNPPKDMNSISKKKKELAVVLTVISQKLKEVTH